MLVEAEVPVESVLKGSAAKVLLHLMSRGGVPGTNAEMMRGSGVHDRNTYYVARDQLQKFGLWENPYRIIQQVVGKTQQGAGKNPAGDGKNPAPLMENPAPQRLRATLEADVVPADEVPLRAKMMSADLLPSDGDWRNPQSGVYLRRQAQIGALREAWKHHFGQDLIESAAKNLLQKAGDSAEAVYDQVEYVLAQPKKIEYPLKYIERVLETAKQKAAQALSVRPVVIGQPDVQDYMMAAPSERTARIEAKLRAMGKLEEDD